MKRPITSLVAGFALFIAQLGAQPTFTVSPQTLTAAAGGNITVDITVTNFTNLLSVQYSMTWNPAILQFVSLDNISASLPGFTAANFGTTNALSAGNIALSWLDPDVVGKSLANATRLYSLTFKVLTGNETTIAFGSVPTVIEVVNSSGTNVGLTPQNSVVNAGGGTPPPAASVTFSASDTTVAPNAMLCTNIRVNGFTNLASVQYSMAFDQTKLQFSSISNLNLSNLTLPNFNTAQAAQGVLTLNWASQGGAGVTVANGTTIYRACFTAIGASACGTPSQFRFTSTPTTAQATNATGGNVTFQSTPGNITICGGSPPPNGFSLLASDTSIASGGKFCTKVRVNGFTNIVSMQYSMAFNQTALRFDSLRAFNLVDLTAASFGTTQANQGILTLSWLDQATTGKSVANGTVIYEVCFTAIGAENCATPSQFRFTNTPTSTEVTNTTGVVPFQSTPGNITICGGTPPPTATVTFSASDTTVAPNAILCTNIRVSGFTNLAAVQYSMAFDQTKLQFSSIANLNLSNLTLPNFNIAQANQGILTLNWASQGGVGVTLANGTTIYRACFTAIGASNCGSPSQFRFTSTPTVAKATNATGGNVTFQSTPANLTICGGTQPPAGFSVVASDTTIAPGGKFCTRVSVNGFTNIVSMQYSMAFDQARLRFDSVTSFNLVDLGVASFGTTQVNQGILTLSWLDQSTIGVTRANGTTIYRVCFTVVGAENCSASTQFRFTNTPTVTEVTNNAGSTLTFQSIAGNVTICGGTPPPPPTGFSVMATDTTIASSGKFCSKVKVNGFTNIVSMQYSMAFDQTKLRFDSIRALNLKDLALASFGTNQAAQGVLTLSWLDQATTGVTLANGTTIYEVCFTAIGVENCTTPSQLRFTSVPTLAEVTNSSGGTVTFQSTSGNITICGGTPPPTDGLKITAGQKVISGGGNACFDVVADNFTKIVSAQFSIKFNSAVIQYASAQGFGLPDLTASNFGIGSAANGILTFSWFDQTTQGITVPNGTVLFQLCFNGIGTGGQTSDISFDGTPTAVEITNASNAQVAPTFISGLATIESSCAGPVVISNPVLTNVTCKGSATGGVAITVSGGTNLYTYIWRNSSGTTVGTQKDLTAVPAGTYTVSVTSCSGTQSSTASYTITEPTQGIGITSQVNNATCFGIANGAINITVTGGLLNPPTCANYTFSWSNGASTKDIGNLAGGTYRLTITDCGACTFVTNPIVVDAPAVALTATTTVTHVKCFGGNSGSITVNAAGGMGPYQYRYNNSVWQNSNTFTNLIGGTYTLDTRDALGCIISNMATVNTPGSVLVVVSTPVHAASGKCDGSITLTVSGGGAPYTYAWSGPGNFVSNTKDLTGLCSGNYNVTVTDANGCSITRTEQISSPLIVSATKRNACQNVCDGSIMLTASGGISPLSYQWNAGLPATPAQSNLCPGSYSVTVTSPADNQSQTLTVNITQATSKPAVNVANVSQPSSSFSCDGAIITTSASGGSGPPYSYKWDNNSTNPSITGLCEGTYMLTLSDGNGCTSLNTYTLDFVPPTLHVTSTVDPSCFSNSIGAINVQASGGIGPYRIVISGPSGTFTQNNDTDGIHKFGNLAPGNYTISVMDSGVGVDFQQTSISATVTVTNLSLAPINIFPATNALKGKITTQPTGGKIPYSFQWSNGSIAQNPSALDADCYVVTVGDANGCFRVFSDICVGLLSAQETITSPKCPDSLGSVIIKPQGGNWPYTYRWRNAAGQVVDNDSILQNQPVGDYNVLITDALGVSILQSYTIKPVSNLAATATATSNYNGFNVHCNGGNTGEARVSAVNGSAPYSYLWSNNASSATVSGLNAGNYTVTVTDKEGCKVFQSVSITAPPVLVANAQGAFIGCSGTKGGQATATVSGGVSPYSFVWSDATNQKTATAVLLSGGNYTVTVTDANGCNSTKSAAIVEPPALSVSVVTTPDEGGPSGTAKAIATGGTRPYTYTWQDLTTADSTISKLFPGRYFVKVTDANRCEKLANGIVDDATNCLFARAVITPEGDGRNEEFKIGCLSRFNDNRLEIYNRWGQLVYETKNYNDGDLWRGTNKRGQAVPDGVYFYVFEYTDPGSKQRLSRKGSVTVLRR